MSNINKVNVNGVEYDIQDKKTLDYLNQQLDYIYDKDEVDTKIKEATQNKASTEYVDNALSNIDLSNYYNKEETNNKILEATNDKATTEYVDNALANIDLSNYYNKEEIDTTLGDIDTILTQIVDSTLDVENKEY